MSILKKSSLDASAFCQNLDIKPKIFIEVLAKAERKVPSIEISENLAESYIRSAEGVGM
jgi:hypothetical protein